MRLLERLPATSTRVEQNTAPELNHAVRKRADAELERLQGASNEQFIARLEELDREWDIERLLQVNASSLALTGLALAYTVDRRFLWLPAGIFTFLAQHAWQGWCPPIPLFRRLGVRTAREIERERYALKVMKGDFDHVPAPGQADASARVRAVLAAVDA
jgi:hypothetical protein